MYARRLAERGFITLAFDPAYQGESEGEPRGLEDPSHRVEDIKAAVSFLSVRDRVAPNRVGALGICASGGYVIPATATDHRIKAVAAVSAVDMWRQFRNGADDHQAPAIIQGMLDAAAAARTAEARGDGVGMFPIFPATEDQARAGGQHVFEGWEYYCTARAQHPRSAKFFTWNSVDRIASFDASRFIAMIAPRPLFMIAGTDAVTGWMTTDAFANAQEPTELCWIKGATHVALYDRDEYVTPAARSLWSSSEIGSRHNTVAASSGRWPFNLKAAFQAELETSMRHGDRHCQLERGDEWCFGGSILGPIIRQPRRNF